MAVVAICSDYPDCLFALNPIVLNFEQAWGLFKCFSPFSSCSAFGSSFYLGSLSSSPSLRGRQGPSSQHMN